MENNIMQSLENAIQYIEENLSNDISINDVAQNAYFSTFDFQRIFSVFTGIPISEYIRRRKMSNAAFEIRNTDKKITEIALKYGYRSPTAFNRAFQSIHGVAPSVVRSEEVELSVFPKLRFNIVISGDEQIKYQIFNKAAFRIVGISISLTLDQEKNFTEIPKFWKRVKENDLISKIYGLMDQEPKGLIGVTIYNSSKEIRYVIGVASTKAVPLEMEAYEIPASLWVRLQCNGAMPHALQDSYKRFFTEWLPSSAYNYSYGPDIEIYGEEGKIKSSIYKCSLWMPIINKTALSPRK